MDHSWQLLAALAQDAHGPRDGDSFDVVIVGAGLSGLRAAYELRRFKPVVLEGAPRIGGRVLTRSHDGVAYDLGAVFAYDTRTLPFDMPAPSHRLEPSSLALYAEGKLHHGADVFECCSARGLNSDEWNALARFAADNSADAQQLPPRVRALLNAFFQVIHPGELSEYLPIRQHDALRSISSTHYVAGNHTLAAELLRRSALGARLRLGASVEAIEDEGSRVRVVYHEGDIAHTIFARAVIVTTPAPITRRLVSPLNPAAQIFLDAVRYEPGIVVAFGIRGAKFPELGCLITPDAPMNTILVQRAPERATHVFLVYYAGDKARRVWNYSDDDLVKSTTDALKQMPLGDWHAREIVFTDIQRWEHVGPMIDRRMTHAWSDDTLHLTPRVLLGGELAALNVHDPMPYGMAAALEGGRRTAVQVQRVLIRPASFARHYLIDATVYQFDEHAPRFVEQRTEGNIAFYGLILQATRDDALRDYLLDAARDDLWEYQEGFGVTAEDSALVLEGLLECDVPRDRLRVSARKLVAQCFDAEQGAFHTLRGGRARYWQGLSVDSSAHLAYLLQEIDADEFAPIVRACAAYVAAQQQADGLWQGKWFPSRIVTTYHAVRLLALFDDDDVLARAHAALTKLQTRRGDWNASVIDTSAAVLALRVVARRDPSVDAAIERGKEWLVAQKNGNGWRGEPILYYWYELDDGTRLFYHCADKGAVTRAWAQIALRE